MQTSRFVATPVFRGRRMKNSSSYVGRVGGLAVALGIGTAVVTCHGSGACRIPRWRAELAIKQLFGDQVGDAEHRTRSCPDIVGSAGPARRRGQRAVDRWNRGGRQRDRPQQRRRPNQLESLH